MFKTIYIDGEETNYSVSEEGEIRNEITGRILKGTLARNEYRSVQLTINGKPKTFMVHRLVATAFCENPNGYTIVHHKDLDKLNNRAENLEWVTAKENMKDKLAPNTEPFVPQSVESYTDWTEIDGHKNYMACREGFIRNKNGRILKGADRNGYLRVSLDGTKLSIHRIVYETFVGPIPDGYIIDHIDGNRQNNSVENLRAISQSNNVKASYGRPRKGQVSASCYSAEGELIKTYPSMQEAADELGVTQVAIKTACNYGTRSCGMFWLREDSITTPEEFVMEMPNRDELERLNGLNRTRVDKNNNVFSLSNKHIIPKFKDENGIYCYISTEKGTYVKFYF